MFFVCGKTCIHLSSSNGQETSSEEIEELCSIQEEADTRIILHCHHIAHSRSESTIIVRSPDTDVFVLLLHFTQKLEQKVLFDTGVGNKRRLIDVQHVIREVGQEICTALPALHAYSGCDTTSAFVRKGKLMPFKTLKKYPQFLQCFHTLGRFASIDDQLLDSLEQFTCLLYGGTATSTINKLRHEKFLERFTPKHGSLLSSYNGADMSLLPPCKDSLKMHIMRANYQALIWYKADEAVPNVPSPQGHGWDSVDGKLEIKWTEGNLMPQELIDVLVETPDTNPGDEEAPEFVNLVDVIFESSD